MIKKPNGKQIDSKIEYKPELDHNQELREKFPVCSQCGDKIVKNEQQILIPAADSDDEYIGVLCSDKCMKAYVKDHMEWYKLRQIHLEIKSWGTADE